MALERLALSADLLLLVLGGMTYAAAGLEHGLTRTAVERRVKSLAVRLIREVGIAGLNESRARFVRKLRSHRPAIEAALACYVPVESSPGATEPVVLSNEDIQNALHRARMRTRTPERDAAMVLILLATGLRPLEVARLEVADYLCEDGTIRITSEVRACVAHNGTPRPLYFASRAARDAIDDYLATRRGLEGQNDLACAPVEWAYRGLDPRAPLFLAKGERAFLIESISTVSGSRSLCQEIHYEYRKIFRRIGVPGLSARTVRHTVMDRLLRRGADKREIAVLLGVRELRSSMHSRPTLDEFMEELV